MTRSATPKLHAYLALVALLLAGAFVTRRPELVVIAAPFALLLAFGAATATAVPAVSLEVALLQDRVLEGDDVLLTVTVTTDAPAGLLDLEAAFPSGLVGRDPPPTLVDVRAAEPRTVTLPVRAERWGVYRSSHWMLSAPATSGLFRDQASFQRQFVLRVYPRPATLDAIVAPRDTQPSAGNLVARVAGGGIEFAEVRPFLHGDELRHVNWRATARRGGLWVNDRHAERNADVILFLDAFADVGSGGGSSLDQTVRAAASLASLYLRHRERVGVIGFGGVLSWLTPGSGRRQLYQIVESLLTTQLHFSYAWKEVSVIPPHVLPPQALVVALTPLADERVVQALFDLLRRGFDLSIIDLLPPAIMPVAAKPEERLARRIWALDRAALLDRYRELGGAVASWDPSEPLEPVIWEVTRFRRHARIVKAS